MTKTKNVNKLLLAMLVIFMAISVVFSFPVLSRQATVKAAVEMNSDNVTITNGDFSSSSSTALQSTPSGWSKLSDSQGKSGIINVKDTNFSNRYTSYALQSTQNPGKAYTSTTNKLDDHVLMINAKSSKDSNDKNNQGYESSAISLSAYSYYKLSLWAYTQGNSFASIYLDGLTDEKQSFEQFQTNGWTEYRFYIATGAESKNLKIQLWLGTESVESYDAVFFDHVTMNQISENYFADEAVANSTVKVTDLRDYTTSLITNANFETGTKEGWTIDGYLPLKGSAQVVNINTPAGMESLGLNYAGSNLSQNNNYSLVLYSKEGSHFAYQSTSFEIKPYECYKVTVSAKVVDFTGSASIMLCEGEDILNFYPTLDEDFYTPLTSSVSISTTNSTSKASNGYTTYSLYVKGHELYSSSVYLKLVYGTEEADAKGAIVFDDVRFEKISSKTMEDSTDSNTAKLELTTITSKPEFDNGTFNYAEVVEKDYKFPIKPSSWTYETSDEDNTTYGIVNTHSKYYDAQKVNYGNAKNPENPSSTAVSINSDVNNVLMLWNKSNAYQSVTSTSFSTASNSYQKITFDYKTVRLSESTKLMNVYILDSDNNVLYADEGISSSNWATYTAYIKTNDHTHSLKLKISLGKENDENVGYLYVDNVKFETDSNMTDESYEAYADIHKTLDFQVGSFNLISTETVNGVYTPFRYTQTLEKGTQTTSGNPIAFGGVINGEDNSFGITNSENNENALKYMPVIRVNGEATYALKSKDAYSLTADSYYKFSIDIQTRMFGNLEQEGVAEDKKAKFGAAFEVTGLNSSFTEVISNNEWTTYTIFVKATEATEANLKLSLVSESNEIYGLVFFDNFKFETTTESEYDKAVTMQESNKLIKAVATSVEEEVEDSTDTETDKDTNWTTTLIYAIPSLILAVALILAVVAYFMKKIKIKKWERKKLAEYDREKTVHRDLIRNEAEKQRDDEIAKVRKEIEEINTEISRIEEINKQRLKEQKRSAEGVTRKTEKEFKAYAQRRTKLVSNVEALEQKIENMNTPEYLLSIQRKIISAKVKQEKEAKALEAKKAKENK